jgi:hypothetical protein
MLASFLLPVTSITGANPVCKGCDIVLFSYLHQRAARYNEDQEGGTAMAVTVVAIRGVELKGDPEPLSVAPVRVRAERRAGVGGGWAARILAIDPRERGGLRREFVRSWSRDVNRRGNGVIEFRIAEPGLYEAEYIVRSLASERVYLAVYPTGEVRIVGYHEPGTRRTLRLEERIAEALAEFEPDPVPDPAPEPAVEPESAPQTESEPAPPVPQAEQAEATPEPPAAREQRPRRERRRRAPALNFDWWQPVTGGFDSTYGGLKLVTSARRSTGIGRFDSTYEGLKPGWSCQPASGGWSFDSTYEGLKPRAALDAHRGTPVSTVPMRA